MKYLIPLILLLAACGSSQSLSKYSEKSEHFSVVDARATKLNIAKKDTTEMVYSPTKQKTIPQKPNKYTMVYSVDVELKDITNLAFTKLWIKPYDALSVNVLKKNKEMINVPTAPGEILTVQAKFKKGHALSGEKTTVLGAPAPFDYEGDGLLEYEIAGTKYYAVIPEISGL